MARYHISERVFWLVCFIISSSGAYYLIKQSLADYSSSSVNMVVESVSPLMSTEFPSIAVCEAGHNTQEFYSSLEEIVKRLQVVEGDENYPYDVEDFLVRVIFPNLYNYGSIISYCERYVHCTTECTKCPENEYATFVKQVRVNCTNLISKCTWNNKTFDCCKYFLPLQTTLGECFLLNSIQIIDKWSSKWLQLTINGRGSDGGVIQLHFLKAVWLFIINEEDIPHMLLTTMHFKIQRKGVLNTILLNIQNVINDDGVRNIDQKLRKCIFPDEEFTSTYKYYSYSVCVTECLKAAQINMCNCTHHNMIYDENDLSPVCNYTGLICLDTNDLIFPQTLIMQPWRTNGLVCSCLPSCTEHEIKIIGRSQTEIGPSERIVNIALQATPTQEYKRQSVKDVLDIVVSVGGIVGLFLGASILSAIECVYFFSVRLIE